MCLSMKLSNWEKEAKPWKIAKSEAARKEWGDEVSLQMVECKDGAVSIECYNAGEESVWIMPERAIAEIKLPERV